MAIESGSVSIDAIDDIQQVISGVEKALMAKALFCSDCHDLDMLLSDLLIQQNEKLNEVRSWIEQHP